MKRRTTAIKDATTPTNAQTISQRGTKEKDQETIKETNKGKGAKGKKIAHPSTIDLLLGSLT